jgi:threonine synthase
VEALLG